MCNRWKNDFLNFYTDLGKRPSKKYALDRINNNGNYEPGNCRWATREQQAANKGDSILYLRPRQFGPQFKRFEKLLRSTDNMLVKLSVICFGKISAKRRSVWQQENLSNLRRES